MSIPAFLLAMRVCLVTPARAQAGMRCAIRARGCLVHRGALSNLGCLSSVQGMTELRHGMLWVCLPCVCLEPSPATAQGGMRDVINAVGRLVQRGVLPSLRRLSMGGGGLGSRAQGLRPDAAPRVETVLLPAGRRPPGQLFWVTDDVLPDLHAALGVRAGHDWERHGEVEARNVCSN